MKKSFYLLINNLRKIFLDIAYTSPTSSDNCLLGMYSTFSANDKKACAQRLQTQYSNVERSEMVFFSLCCPKFNDIKR